MKSKIYTGTRVSFSKCFFLLLGSLFAFSAIQSQTTYFSSFSNPTGRYSVSQPGGCFLSALPPGINSASNVSNSSLSDYASLSFSIANASLACTSGEYLLIADLNLDGLSPAVIPASAGNSYSAGFRVGVSSAALISLLGSNGNMAIRTYMNGTLVESVSSGLIGLSALQSGSAGDISFQATQPFNQVAVALSPGALNVGLLSSIDFFYGFANTAIVLPVKLTSFSAMAEGKSVALNWATASEINVAKYELQRSSDGGTTFSTITSVAAKGNTASETRYRYADGTAFTGVYTYRLKMIDKDGGAEFSKLASVKLVTSANWKIYPTLLNSGADLNVNLTTVGSGKTQIQLANLQGQILRVVSNSTNDKLTINTSGLSGGVYVLKLYKDGQLQASEKVVIQ